MTTECNQFVLGSHPQKRREIRAQFDGGAITSDGGGLLLRGSSPLRPLLPAVAVVHRRLRVVGHAVRLVDGGDRRDPVA